MHYQGPIRPGMRLISPEALTIARFEPGRVMFTDESWCGEDWLRRYGKLIRPTTPEEWALYAPDGPINNRLRAADLRPGMVVATTMPDIDEIWWLWRFERVDEDGDAHGDIFAASHKNGIGKGLFGDRDLLNHSIILFDAADGEAKPPPTLAELARDPQLLDKMRAAEPSDEGIDWAQFLPKEPLPDTGPKTFQVGEVWAAGTPSGDASVYKITLNVKGAWPFAETRVLAGYAWASVVLNSQVARRSRLIRRADGTWVDEPKKAEPPKPVTPTCNTCHKPEPLGIAGRCWGCELKREENIRGHVDALDESRSVLRAKFGLKEGRFSRQIRADMAIDVTPIPGGAGFGALWRGRVPKL